MRPPRPQGPWFLLPTDPWGEAAIDAVCFGRMLEYAAGERGLEIKRSILLATAIRSTIIRQMRGLRPLLGPLATPDGTAESNRTWLAFERIAKLKQKYTRLTAIAAQGLDAL